MPEVQCTDEQARQSAADEAARMRLEASIEGKSTRIGAGDAELEQWRTPMGTFWIPGGNALERFALFYLLAEHVIQAEQADRAFGGPAIHRGDVVFDCGAHVGTFTRVALRAGARLVIAIEPSPVTAKALARNFADEVRRGRVIVVARGVWNEVTERSLHTGGPSPGHSLVMPQNGADRVVSLTTIDRLVDELKLPRVDYIKMDIEGAEREALRGAQRTLARFRPRLSLSVYHLTDDLVVVPQRVREAVPAYWMSLPHCFSPKIMEGQWPVPRPYNMYFR